MLQRFLVLIYLLALFVGIFAQRSEPDAQKRIKDMDAQNNAVKDNQPERSIRFSHLTVQQSTTNDTIPVRSNSMDVNDSANIQPLVVQPILINHRSNVFRSVVGSLADSAECRLDIQRYCAKGGYSLISNLKVLQCIDDLDNAVNLIGKDCQYLIYKFKYNMIHNARFDDAALRHCSNDINVFDDCNEQTDDRPTGRLVSCLYDHLNNITEPGCRYFINQMQIVTFNDWRLTEYFADACIGDISRLECGRLDDDNTALLPEPGAVVSCLSQRYPQLSGSCQKEIFRLAEMQSDDYHLDRALYYACRDDRERLCSQVLSGNGRVYRCLYEQKFNIMMTSTCRNEVHRRQRLVISNVLVDVPLIRACRSEMIENKCAVDPQDSDKRSSLVKLLLCLGNIVKKGYHINDECRREMLIHRRMLMSDYALSPEIVLDCKSEMIQHCSLLSIGANGASEQRGGKMIHCLLNAAHREKRFSVQCLSVVSVLVRAVDPGEDIRADPLLETACWPVIDTLCPKVKSGDSNKIMYLLDNLKNTRMTEECEDRLMEVAYFMARDFRLTPRLLRTCQTNLINLCQLPEDWSMSKEMADVQVGKYLGCLHQQRHNLEGECRSELKRLMRIRTQAISLMPEIEDNCITDLATCKNPETKGEEMKCLQKKYDQLESQCKAAVRSFTRMTMTDPSLDFLLMKACESIIQLFCSNIEDRRENDLIRCLIKHKNEQKMDFRCKAGIDHHQITSMKDTAFLSQQFQIKCTREIAEHCSAKKTKSAVVQCLADLISQDLLKKKSYVSEACRDELKFELFQRSESIDFDPSLARACRNDIRKLCSDRIPGNAEILDCLKDNHNKVSTPCFGRLRKREKLDVILPEHDYSLMSKCDIVIQKYCSNEHNQNILSCLRRNINQDAMPNICRHILYHRLMILNTDVRLNKALIENCGTDIMRYCTSEIIDDDDKDSDEDENKDDDSGGDEVASYEFVPDVADRKMGGRIIQCLRSKYTDTSVSLESQCVTELFDAIQTSKLDVKLDIKLYQSCRVIFNTKCTGMDQEDCLKLLYQKGELRDNNCKEEVKRIIKEGRLYINADHALFFACQLDILQYCNDIPRESGKQLQCLLSMNKSVTNQCYNMLSKRQELWNAISDVNGAVELTRHIPCPNKSLYLYPVIFVMLCIMFMAGYLCRPRTQYIPVNDIKY